MVLFGNCLARMKDEMEHSTKVRMAVAFWGSGAGKNLGLLPTKAHGGRDAKIICNLRMGGTNSKEIHKLMKAGIKVKHSDQLHAKVYRFDTSAIVGSANASSNGLGFEGGEAHWNEAGVVVKDDAQLAQIDAWFKSQWHRAKEVTKADLDEAARNFAYNRGSRTKALGVLASLRRDPAAFKGLPLYLACTDERYSRKTADHVTRKNAAGQRIEAYDNWEDIPPDAVLIDFTWYDRRSKPVFQGIHRTPPAPRHFRVEGATDKTVEVAVIEATQPGEFPVLVSTKAITAELDQWQDLIKAIQTSDPAVWKEASGVCRRVDTLIDNLDIKHVLNVFDRERRLKHMSKTKATSGNWHAPEVEPTFIRVYQAHGGASVAGGKITERKKEATGRVVIHFKPDRAEVGKPWPSKPFRQTGTVPTSE